MKKFAAALCGAFLIGSFAAPASAQPGAWGIDARIAETQRAIDHGVGDGALDRRQYDHVQQLLLNVRHHKERLQARGPLTPDNVRQFEIDLDNIIAEIHWERAEWRRPW
jgi:hypothetical protein